MSGGSWRASWPSVAPRNGVFYADAIAIALWLERGVEYLERLEELAVARGDP